MSALESRQPRSKPAPITTGEFIRRAEAGEDLDEYFAWENPVVVEPGELSPTDKIMPSQVMLDTVAGVDLNLNVPITAALHLELARAALQHQMSREALVQSWIVQHLEKQRTAI